MQVFAKKVALFVAGRFFNYCAIGFATVFVPMYQAETAPPAFRGVVITMYQFNVVVGSFLISVVDNFTAKYMGLPAGKFLSAYFYSPRWLVKNSKIENAMRALLVLHHGEESFDVHSEIRLLMRSVHHQEELNLAVYMWFYVPETRGNALDDLDEIFEQRMPTRKFNSYQLHTARGIAGTLEDAKIKTEEVPAGEQTHTWELKNEVMHIHDKKS
ncbi:hypothetical protein V1515DRAFT_580636 [Lipomyces mesembrius]